MFGGLTQSEHDRLMSKAFHADDPIQIEPTIVDPQISFGIIIGFKDWEEDEETGLFNINHHPHVPCVLCNADLGQIQESCRSIHLSLGHEKDYVIGSICAKHIDEPDLPLKVRKIFADTLRNLADTVEKANLSIAKEESETGPDPEASPT